MQRVTLLGDAATPELHIARHVCHAGAGIRREPGEASQVAALLGQRNQLLQRGMGQRKSQMRSTKIT